LLQSGLGCAKPEAAWNEELSSVRHIGDLGKL
jgi:hypothetical protein